MSELNKFKSRLNKCPSCKCNEFESNGESRGDNWMVESDEIECLNCGRLAIVYCFDGFCNAHWHKQ